MCSCILRQVTFHRNGDSSSKDDESAGKDLSLFFGGNASIVAFVKAPLGVEARILVYVLSV